VLRCVLCAQNGWTPLLYAAFHGHASVVKRVGYAVTTLLDRGATKAAMRRALDAFAEQLGRGGVAFFYFSGHGMMGADGKNYLLPVEGVENYEDLEDDAISLERVNARLEGSGSLLHVVVADACRSKPPPMKSRSKSAAATQQKGFTVLSAAPAEAGSVMAFSCSPGKVSWDAADGGGRNGAFTTALLRHLTTPEQHVDTLFTRAARDCQELTKKHPELQVPWRSANLTHEHVCLF
jgi:uncharacterized caspase-like protein